MLQPYYHARYNLTVFYCNHYCNKYRDTLINASIQDVMMLREKVFRSDNTISSLWLLLIEAVPHRMESQLGEFELQKGIKHRWQRTDKEYIDAQHASLLEKKEALYASLRAAVVRCHYLLKLKAKYAG